MSLAVVRRVAIPAVLLTWQLTACAGGGSGGPGGADSECLG
jgi:hypothetical protein